MRASGMETIGSASGIAKRRCCNNHCAPSAGGHCGKPAAADGAPELLRAGSAAVRNEPLQGDGGTDGENPEAACGRYRDA